MEDQLYDNQGTFLIVVCRNCHADIHHEQNYMGIAQRQSTSLQN